MKGIAERSRSPGDLVGQHEERRACATLVTERDRGEVRAIR